MRIVKTPQLPSRKVCMKRLSLGWPGACHSAWLLLSNQSSFPSRPVHEHALILQPGLLCPHIRRSASSQQGWESVRPGTEPNGSNGPKKLIEIDQTSLIWAPFLRTGHMHCRTGRPASQHVASKCFKPPEIAWNSLIVSGPNTQTICLYQTNHTRKKVGIFDKYVGSALLKVDPDMDLPTLISSVLGPLADYLFL